MPRLYLDFETRSVLDLKIHGLVNYMQHPSTEVLMMAYALDDEPVEIWEPRMGPMPEFVEIDIEHESITKVAWNSPFERAVFEFMLHLKSPAHTWDDPQVRARMLSMPGKLDVVCQILQLPTDLAKDAAGKELKKLFCIPVDKGGWESLFGTVEAFFHDWSTKPAEWQQFLDYCKQDVEALRVLDKRLIAFPLPEIEKRGWLLDQKINERGLPVDIELVTGTSKVAAAEKSRLKLELTKLTGLQNVNSNPQMLDWLQKRGYPFASLGKPLVKRAMGGEGSLSDEAKKALTIRAQTAKTSDSKLETIFEVVNKDGRLRHQYIYLGAAKTGRWASFHVQMTNLPRPTKEVEKNLDLALALLRDQDLVSLALDFPNTLEVVSSSIRSMFRAGGGKQLVIADLSAIENRMIGWLAQCDSILRVFREKRDPYLDFAALVMNLEYDELAAAYKRGEPKAKEMRQQAKPAVLGCGYRLSGGEEVQNEDGDKIKTGLWGYAAGMGIEMKQDDAARYVEIFRERYPEIVTFWYALEEAAIAAVRDGEVRRHAFVKGHEISLPVEFRTFGDKLLRILLPSGRGLFYIRPRIEMLEFRGKEKPTLTFEGVDMITKKWTRLKTHGGKLLENLSQAISRDILLNGMLNADEAGFSIIGHVHDEIICEEKIDSQFFDLEKLVGCMTRSPEWALDLPLGADGFVSEVYRK